MALNVKLLFPLSPMGVVMGFAAVYGCRMTHSLRKNRARTGYDEHESLGVALSPLLIVGGTNDMVPTEANGRIHESIKGSTLTVLDSCGHFPYIESPKKFFSEREKFLSLSAN